MLHCSHKVWRFSRLLVPPLENARIWSICNLVPISVAGLFPQKTHLKLSRFITFILRLKGMVLVFAILFLITSLFGTVFFSTMSFWKLTLSPDLYSINCKQAFFQLPKRLYIVS